MISGLVLGIIAHIVATAVTAAVWAKCPIDSPAEASANKVLDFFFSWQSVVSFGLIGALLVAA